MREHATAIRADGNLPPASGFRDYAPGERVKARLELSAGGWMRGREAGIDVMGDGALVPHAGAFRRRLLTGPPDADPVDLVRQALS